jgi:hypothetical protein
MASAATALRDAVKERLHPLIEQHGFVRHGKSDALFTGFRRVRDGKLHVLDVQWDKYHRPYFVVNFGEAPLADLELSGARVPVDQIAPFDCPQRGRMQRFRGGSMSCWVGLRKPWIKVLTTGRWSYRPEEVADEAGDAFPELEEWWTSRTAGPHLYILGEAAS